jgi:hypothetical protein
MDEQQTRPPMPAARGFHWVTDRRVTVATALLVAVALAGVVLSSAQRVLY